VSIFPVDCIGGAEVARNAINRWVAQKTGGHIQGLVPKDGLDAWTRLVLVDAAYFKGSWASAFDPALTKKAAFRLASGEPVETPMMTQMKELLYADLDSLQALQLQYRGKLLSMLILLPRAPYNLERLEAHISSNALERWRSFIRPREVRVFLPKFSMTQEFRVDKVLMSMGMVDAFMPSKADFSGMTPDPNPIFIGAVFQKAFVEVEEKGTKAAAATAVKLTRAVDLLSVFRADHPFLFLIQDDGSGSVLFMGRVADPTRS